MTVTGIVYVRASLLACHSDSVFRTVEYCSHLLECVLVVIAVEQSPA